MDLEPIKIELDTTEADAKITALTDKVDVLLGKLKECSGLCESCSINAEFKIKGADLVAIGRLENYRKG